MKTYKSIPIAFLFLLAAFFYSDKRYFDSSQICVNRAPTRFLVLHQGGVGEREFIKKMEIAAKGLGWECYSCSTRIPFWGKYFKNPLTRAICAVDPDFTLNFQSKVRFAPGINFVSLSSGSNLYFGPDSYLDMRTLIPFDGYLPTFSNIDLLESAITTLGKPYKGIQWFFTSPYKPYKEIAPNRLFYCGVNWDASRKKGKYQRLFCLLDQEMEIDIYGPRSSWKNVSKSYRGSLPFDGKSLSSAMQKAGIVLILHSESHIKGNSPTARIFEAAAASCVIISDSHPFIQKEFGSSVLYIDQNVSAEEMQKQIQKHYSWIKKHPEEAKALAKRAHEIFEEKFLLEDQLQRLKLKVAECLETGSSL